MKLDPNDRIRARELFSEWEELSTEDQEIASRISSIESELAHFGIDPDSPPSWIDSE